jgi:hypothetical protein
MGIEGFRFLPIAPVYDLFLSQHSGVGPPILQEHELYRLLPAVGRTAVFAATLSACRQGQQAASQNDLDG